MRPDKEVKALVKNPMYGLSFGKVAQIYGADLKREARNNDYYRTRDKTIILGANAESRHLCHELAHHLQYKLEDRPYGNNFDEILAFERQAERVAYLLHKNHFGWVPHQRFNAYTSQWQKDFLWQWHFGDPSPYLEE